jgi:hypothetical protein
LHNGTIRRYIVKPFLQTRIIQSGA